MTVPITLIGPGGAGKSTVGALVAERLGLAFVDLDRRFETRAGDISEYINRLGYRAYARENVEIYCSLIDDGGTRSVVAVSSGFMTYPRDVHPEYERLRRSIDESAATFVLIPSLDRDRCVAETVRRQLVRPFARSAEREEAVIRERFPVYVGLRAPKIETMRPLAAVVEELVARTAELSARRVLPADAASALEDRGFAVLTGVVAPDRMTRLSDAYDTLFASARGGDIRVGSTSTKVAAVAGHGVFDELLAFPPLLEACGQVIRGPFKLSSFSGRTVRAGSPSQEWHVDVQRDSTDWPLLTFILMVDDFRPDNGATRFVPGSHHVMDTPGETMPDVRADHERQTFACGPAGSLLVFTGSVWHGHGANRSSGPRRSLQGAFIPRNGRAATDFAARIPPETRARLDPLARYVLAL